MANNAVKDAEDMTAEELEKSIAAGAVAAQPDAAETPSAPEVQPDPEPKEEVKKEESGGFEYTAADGTVYRDSTSEGLFKKVTDALNMTKAAVKDREHQIHGLKRQTPKPEETPEPKPPAAFDNQKYLDLLSTNAKTANDYLKEHDPEIQEFRRTRAEEEAKRAVNEEVMKFYNETGYNKVETPELNSAIRERMEQKGRPNSALGLGMTYYELKAEGKIPDASGSKPPSKRTPPPETPSGSGGSVADEPDVDSMSAKELAAHLRKQGVEVWE